ncbi:hypothetical protein [Halodesulfovibrio sp. MK-HDV]|jgi:hypothetical protein|uniref:hypothetical protein n=1 Tax=Halodesulfovibrio sp. MK-HDV TaxID=2599925 RepID=UPI001371FDE5|nr:hypothetical protein [Halodesulfovibrio sp. MK-HDV]KAF1074536.1 hypothetical protein MKHDV_02611 [Halodesulfovibrio sp. MK-HDV]
MFFGLAWKNKKNTAIVAHYGIKSDQYRDYLKVTYRRPPQTIDVYLHELNKQIKCNLTQSFWGSSPVIRHSIFPFYISHANKGLLWWPKGSPIEFVIIPTKSGCRINIK